MILDLIDAVYSKHQIASVSGYTHTQTQKQKHTFCFHPRLFWFIQSLPSSAHLYSFPTHSTHFCQGSKDKLGPNRGPGRFQPKDKAGLVNFEEEQFLEVSWLLRLAAGLARE